MVMFLTAEQDAIEFSSMYSRRVKENEEGTWHVNELGTLIKDVAVKRHRHLLQNCSNVKILVAKLNNAPPPDPIKKIRHGLNSQPPTSEYKSS